MTVRQLFYRLVSIGEVENTHGHYQRVSRVMTKARDDGRCDFDRIVDRSRPTYAPNVFEDLAGYAYTIKRAYRKDYWAMQPYHVELWVEKDAIIGSIEELTDELGITVRVGRGFVSTTKVHEIAQIFARIPKPKWVFYLGDFDGDGVFMEHDQKSRILAYGSGPFEMRRLAIFGDDIKRFNLPPLRVKDGPRSEWFQEHHGDECVELDALPPTELRRRVRKAVDGVMDREQWERAVRVEEVEIASIQSAVEQWGLRA